MRIPLHIQSPFSNVPHPNTDIGQTQYERMLEEQDRTPLRDIILAHLSNWLLLAGYLVVPATFTSLQKSRVKDSLGNQGAQGFVLHTIQNPPLVGISCIFFFLGACGMTIFAIKWKHNFLLLIKLLQWVPPVILELEAAGDNTNWQSHRPTSVNGAIGLITTIVNVYSAQTGRWSIMAILTIIITSLSVLVSAALVFYLHFIKGARIKAEHEEISSRMARSRRIWESSNL